MRMSARKGAKQAAQVFPLLPCSPESVMAATGRQAKRSMVLFHVLVMTSLLGRFLFFSAVALVNVVVRCYDPHRSQNNLTEAVFTPPLNL